MGIVVAELLAGIWKLTACNVEVSECGPAEIMHAAIEFNRLLSKKLRDPVWVHRPQWIALSDGNTLGIAVNRCRGREHQLQDFMSTHRLKEVQSAYRVGLHIAPWLRNRF